LNPNFLKFHSNLRFLMYRYYRLFLKNLRYRSNQMYLKYHYFHLFLTFH
jgi:hypothetical protein